MNELSGTSPQALRQQNYANLGTVLALTAGNIGALMTEELRTSWVDSTALLARADDLSEAGPEPPDDPMALLEALDVRATPQVTGVISNLLVANYGSR